MNGGGGLKPFLAQPPVGSSWKPCGLAFESASADFHGLRQEFIPPKREG